MSVKTWGKAFLVAAVAVFGFNSFAMAQGLEVKFAQANGLNIAYTETGEGEPLLLLHGGGMGPGMWQNQVDALAARYHVIMPQTRGHVGTDNPSHEFNYKLLADDVAALIDALGLKDPIVMGVSDGGIITMTLGIFHPGLAKALVIGAAVPPTTQADLDHYFEGMAAYYAPVTKRTALTEADLDAMYAADPDSWDFMAMVHAKPGDPNYWRTLMTDVWLTWNDPRSYAYTPEQLARISVPALVILGDHDEFYLAEGAARLAAQLPMGELAVLPNAGHNAFRAKSDLYNALLLDFLGRLEN